MHSRGLCSRRELLYRISSVPGCFAAAALAQQTETPRLSVTTRVVQVTVTVHDGNGRAVNDLTKEDFTVLDNGKTQVITSFVQSLGERPAPPPRVQAAPVQWSNRGESMAGALRTVTALVFDGLNTNIKDQVFAKDQVLRFLRRLRPGDSVGLYLITTDLRVLHDFTDDSESLVHTFESHDPKVLAQWARERAPASMRGRLRHDRATFTLSALRAVGEHLSRIPGRKNLIWVTSGFPMLIMERERGRPGYIESMIPEMRATAQAIGDANVALYPVSAMGLVGMPQMSAAEGATRTFGRGSRSLGPTITHSRQAGPLEDTMKEMAEATGGRAFYERNDLDVAFDQAIEDLGSSYTLTFQPSHGEWNGKFRKIRVQLKRRGVKVRHRPGYVAVPDGPADSRDAHEVLMDAIDNPLDSTGIGLTATFESGDEIASKLRVQAEGSAVTLIEEQGHWKGRLLVAMVGQPDSEEALAQPEVREIAIDFTPERYDEAMKQGIILTKVVPAALRSRGLRIVVVDIASCRAGSVNIR